jgi:SAM-dependent methyltransferase
MKYLKSKGDKDGLSVLELGSGIARYSFVIAKQVPCLVVGVDLLEHELIRAEKLFRKFNKVAMFVMADVTNLPFRDDVFDFVHSQGLYEHFIKDHRYKVLKESARVLKKGGLLFFTVPNALSLWKLVLTIGRFRKHCAFPDEYPLSIKEAVNEVKKVGLIPLGKGGVNFHFYVDTIIGNINRVLKRLRSSTLSTPKSQPEDYGESLRYMLARCIYVLARKPKRKN